MNSRRWITLTLATILTAGVVDAIVAFAVDPYGIWRDPHGRSLPVAVITTARKAKFLLSERYVPANFDGLILGPSSVANWDVPSLAGARIYNLAIAGADASEEKLILDQALRRGHYRFALIALAPIMTATHDVQSGLDTTKQVEALASFHLYIQELAYALRATHHGAGYIDIADDGHYNYPTPKNFAFNDPDPSFFILDPVAVDQCRQMVKELQAQGATVVYVIPPLYEPLYDRNKARYQGYASTILSLLPKAPVIDFQAAEYTALRSDRSNFIDGQHLAHQGEQQFSAVVEQLVPEALSGKATQ